MTDPVELSQRWVDGLDDAREQYDRTDFGLGRPFVNGQPAVPPMTKDERWLRESIAFGYCGAGLYADDGELQDAREQPAIDFLRDPPEVIQAKMRMHLSPPRGIGDFKVICDESNNPPEEVAKNVLHADIVLNPENPNADEA